MEFLESYGWTLCVISMVYKDRLVRCCSGSSVIWLCCTFHNSKTSSVQPEEGALGLLKVQSERFSSNISQAEKFHNLF